jgi:hypothetical protein
MMMASSSPLPMPLALALALALARLSHPLLFIRCCFVPLENLLETFLRDGRSRASSFHGFAPKRLK